MSDPADALRRDPGIADPDGFHAALVAANEGLTAQQSLAFALRLVLLLANQVGDPRVLAAAVAAAREGVEETP